MMKIVAICLAAVALARAAPQQPADQPPADQAVQILKQDSLVSVDGYHFEFETSDGTARQERGELKDPMGEHPALSVQGSYRYVAPDGQHYAVTFLADENGFQPSTHLEQQGGSPPAQQDAQPPQYQQDQA